MRKDILKRKDDIINWINEHQSKAFICGQLNCKPETLNKYIEEFGIIYKGNMGLTGLKDYRKKSVVEYIKQDIVRSVVLKKKLIEGGYKKDVCDECGIGEWNGIKLALELHHKDGNRFNNDFDNLQILCPNCHSITPNFRGRKNKKEKEIKKKKIIVKIIKCNGKPNKRIVRRPPYEALIEEINNSNYCAVGRKYGVSDNAIRKWKRFYEKQKLLNNMDV